ncbi:hypothetical protein BKA66DRAFT_471936 [Pyrenochaeta sp. MPI-SDFR-AT-0127]|nr:hypothetical protein BKA66DRAFT_471936 [Pyrenochaeta sp. MPI-SDFR-AT-0127]
MAGTPPETTPNESSASCWLHLRGSTCFPHPTRASQADNIRRYCLHAAIGSVARHNRNQGPAPVAL